MDGKWADEVAMDTEQESFEMANEEFDRWYAEANPGFPLGVAAAGIAGIGFFKSAIKEAQERQEKQAREGLRLHDLIENGVLRHDTNIEGILNVSASATPTRNENYVDNIRKAFDKIRNEPLKPAVVLGVPDSVMTHRHEYNDAPTLETIIKDLFNLNNQQKETEMTSIKENLQNQIDRASSRLANLERFPETEDFPVGTLIGFDKRFPAHGPKVFNYAGVKTDIGWFITGRNASQVWRWDALMTWMAEHGETLNLVVCSEVTELIEPIEVDGAAYEEAEVGE